METKEQVYLAEASRTAKKGPCWKDQNEPGRKRAAKGKETQSQRQI